MKEVIVYTWGVFTSKDLPSYQKIGYSFIYLLLLIFSLNLSYYSHFHPLPSTISFISLCVLIGTIRNVFRAKSK